jgi:deoxyhypusine synthase
MENGKMYYQLKKAPDLSHLPKIKGYDFEKEFDINKFLDSYFTTGIQASNLGKSIDIINMMVREEVSIYLSFTSNMISSGIREIIKYLVKHKKIHVISTSAGGVEEDIIKAKDPFRLGSFDASGKNLFENGLGRIGNIFVTNEHYTHLDRFLVKVFDELRKKYVNEKGICVFSPSELFIEMGIMIEKDENFDHESSYIYHAYKNNIPVYCPGVMDGTIGDIMYFYQKSNKNFIIDVSKDHEKIIDYTLNQEKTGAIVLGGATPKHYIMNANIFREGFDYAVYVSTATTYDASDSGGNEEEAKTWAKIKIDAPHTKVYCDASIAFPLIVAGTFAKKID